MRKSSLLTVSLILFSFATLPSYAQQTKEEPNEKIYELIPSGNGVVRSFVGREGGEKFDAFKHQIYSHPGLPRLLDSISSSDLGVLLSDEFTPDQKTKFESLVKNFNESMESKDENIHVVRSRFIDGLSEILIPEQMLESLNRFKDSQLPMTLLLASSVGAELELSNTQKATLLKACNEVNEDIHELFAEVEEKTKALRLRLTSVYSETLNPSQKAQFEKKVPLKKQVDQMKLSAIQNDTSFANPLRK